MRNSPRLRYFVAAIVTFAVLAAGLVATTGTATAAGTSQASDAESSFFTLMNGSRASAGLPALQVDTALANTARTWSANMSATNQLYHDPNLLSIVQSIEPQWRSGAENVGYGYDVKQLHDAFMNSAGHRASIMSTRFNRAGIGVVYNGTKIWVTVRFIEGPALTAAAAPAPTPAGVRSALTGDFNGDGLGDVLIYGPGGEADELWFASAGWVMRKVPVSIKGQYQPITGDFDGDRRTEILWYAPGPATDSIWEWNGSAWSSRTKTINGYYTARAGDFDGDRIDDVLWYAPGTARDYRWYGNTSGGFTSLETSSGGLFLPVVGDFDGNGGEDVFWYGRGATADLIWYSTRQRGAHNTVGATAGGSHTPFAGDFDGNGSDDIFFYTPGSAADAIWYNAPGAFGGSRVAEAVNGTYLPGSADFDANARDDILWYSVTAGAAGDPLWWGVWGLLGTVQRVLGTLTAA